MPRLVLSSLLLPESLLLLGLLAPAAHLRAETVDALPAPTGYVNDFAGVLSPGTVQQVDAECREVQQKANAQIAVVTVKTIDPDKSGATPTIEEFAVKLEEKWRVGAKGTDRGVLMVLVMNPRRGRIEVGYGLEGVLTDARSGDIAREMSPYARNGDYNDAVKLGVQDLAAAIAKDAGVTLDAAPGAAPAQPPQQYRQDQPRAGQQQTSLSFGQIVVLGGVALVILILLAATGNLGLVFWFLLNMIGGGGGRGGGFGGGGGGGGRDGDGGGFSGFGGGSSGGGGASGDF